MSPKRISWRCRATLVAMLVSLAAATPAAGQQRPPLMRHNGQVFAYSIPQGWTANETTNGLDLIAPDGVTGVSGSFVLGMAGAQSPEQYLTMVLGTVPLASVRVTSRRQVPPQPGPMGLPWQGIEVEMTGIYRGQPVHVRAISQVVQGAGQYSAMLTAMQGPAAQWSALSQWLPAIRDRIALVNPGPAGESMRRALPKGIRHDEVYGNYNKGWHERGVPMDAISAAQREGTMGYTRLEDPATGQKYDMPLDRYSASRGGFINPVRPTELLVPTRD